MDFELLSQPVHQWQMGAFAYLGFGVLHWFDFACQPHPAQKKRKGKAHRLVGAGSFDFGF